MSTTDCSKVLWVKPDPLYNLEDWLMKIPADPDKKYSNPQYEPDWHLCKNNEEETLESIAGDTDCKTWEELVHYNWNLDPADKNLTQKVNYYLGEYCGCRKAQGTDAQPGPNYIFHYPPLGKMDCQRILVPKKVTPPPEQDIQAGRGEKPNTKNDCRPIAHPGYCSVRNSTNRAVLCYQTPDRVTHTPPTIRLKPRNASKVESEFQQIKSAIVTLSRVQITNYKDTNYLLYALEDPKDPQPYTWTRDTLMFDLSTETGVNRDRKPVRGSVPSLTPPGESSYLLPQSEQDFRSLANLISDLEEAGLLQEFIVRGYPDSNERDAAYGGTELAEKRAQYIVDRLKTEYGLLRSLQSAAVTTLGCTGVGCGEFDHAAAYEIVANQAPSPGQGSQTSGTQFVYSCIFDRYEGPDLGPDFQNPPWKDPNRPKISDLPHVTRSIVSWCDSDKEQFQPATNPNDVANVRNDAMCYLDSFVQAMYPDRNSPGNGDMASADDDPIQKISDWIHYLRLDGEVAKEFPPLPGNDTKSAWKDMVEGKVQSGPYVGPAYTVASAQDIVIPAMSDLQSICQRLTQASPAKRWLYGVLRFGSMCPYLGAMAGELA